MTTSPSDESDEDLVESDPVEYRRCMSDYPKITFDENLIECDNVKCDRCSKWFCMNCDKTEIEENIFANYVYPYNCDICHRNICSQCSLGRNFRRCVECGHGCADCTLPFKYGVGIGICIKCIKKVLNDTNISLDRLDKSTQQSIDPY